MSSSIDAIYYSKNNLDSSFAKVSKEVMQRTNKNIANNPSYKKTFEKMAVIVFDKIPSNERNIIKCNNVLIEKSVQYFHTKIFGKQVNMPSNNTSAEECVSEPINKPSMQSIDFTIQPFNINDDLTNSKEFDMPLYQNIDKLQQMHNMDPMHILDDYTKQRQHITAMQHNNNTTSESNMGGMSSNDYQDSMDRHMIHNNTNTNIVANVINNEHDNNERQQLMVNTQRFEQPKYIEKVHYININSVDRNWEDNDTETRYNFQVKFNQNQSYEGSATISNIYRNVVSVEMVSAIMPMDATINAFDTRIYMGLSRFPYLLLRINELDNVFKGTNNWVDKAFSTMIFDKLFFTNTLSTDYISGYSGFTSIVQSTPRQGFTGEYLRGFMKYNPAYFEKKKFYNNALASLNRMTLSITDPRGNFINVQKDVLDLTSIAFTGNVAAVSGTELIPCDAWPRSTQGSYSYVKLTTTTYFSNRLFRIGDRIVIKKFAGATGANGPSFTSFINRDEGHIILNLAVETNGAANTNNRGFINEIYIAPAGEMDSTNNTVDAATYYASGVTFGTVSSYGRLINIDMQTQLLFRIVCRDPDTNDTINPVNVY